MKEKLLAETMREIAIQKRKEKYSLFETKQGAIINKFIERIAIEADKGSNDVAFTDSMFDKDTCNTIKEWMPQIIKYLESQGFRVIVQHDVRGGFILGVGWANP